jgi:hypothetical protein
VVAEGLLESVHELAAKNFLQYRLGKKVVLWGADPVGVIEGKATGRNDTMDMGMQLDFLVLGVQHAEEADLGAEMLGVTSHFEECLGTGLEQEMVEDLFVLQGERRQLMG